MQHTQKKVVIIGGGFGGLFCAKGLIGSDIHITLIDRQNHHLFQPLLYQVATGFLGANDVGISLRALFRDYQDVEVVLDEAQTVDTEEKVVLTSKAKYRYDYLVIATGSAYNFFGHEEWQQYVSVLKSVADALAIRKQIILAFEQAEIEENITKRGQLLTFVIIGGGPTGVEMAGAIADLLYYIIEAEYRHIKPDDVKIILVEAGTRLLSFMPEALGQYAQKTLAKRRVEIHYNSVVREIQKNKVVTDNEIICSDTIIWAAGVQPVTVSTFPGLPQNLKHNIIVGHDLAVSGVQDVFAIGDCSALREGKEPWPALAAVAKQQGKYVAKLIRNRVKKKQFTKPFHYLNLGTMAVIGRNAAVADFGKLYFKGWFAWVLWSVVHIYFLVGFRNRLVTAMTWLWTYLTYGLGDRIVTRDGKINKEGER